MPWVGLYCWNVSSGNPVLMVGLGSFFPSRKYYRIIVRGSLHALWNPTTEGTLMKEFASISYRNIPRSYTQILTGCTLRLEARWHFGWELFIAKGGYLCSSYTHVPWKHAIGQARDANEYVYFALVWIYADWPSPNLNWELKNKYCTYFSSKRQSMRLNQRRKVP